MNYLEKLFSLEGKTVIVTGAAGGNGTAISRGLLMAGASVIMTDVSDSIHPLADELFALGDACPYRCDLSNLNDIHGLVEYAKNQYGTIDVLVNNAGVTFPCNTLQYPAEEWEKTQNINVRAPFELSRLISQVMIKNSRGSIINITSLNAELAFPDNPAYMASKGALRQLTKSFAYDLGKHGIRCNNVGPGYMRTAMTSGSWADPKKRKVIESQTALGRWGEPNDLVGVIIFLSSDASSYITGQDIYVDGGWLIKGI